MSEKEAYSDLEENDFFESEENIHKCNSIKKLKNSMNRFEMANPNLHFLPIKISHTGHCKVNVFFDPLVEFINGNNYKSSFRGRIYNGKKINTDENFKINYISMNKKENFSDNNKSCKVNNIREIKDFFIWKFDEEVPYNNNLLKMGEIMKNLDSLK